MAITGMGVISPVGNNVAAMMSSLRQGRTGVRAMPKWAEVQGLGPSVSAQVDNVDLKQSIPRKFRRSMGRVAQLCCYATKQAVEHAGLTEDMLQSGRVGVALGSTTGSAQATLDFYANILGPGLRANKSMAFFQVMAHTCAANVALALGITGRVWSPNSACTSGSQGIGLALDCLRGGTQDIMICGGAEEAHYTTAGTFDLVGAASRATDPQHTPRPFDAQRDGMVIGEGAGVLILERWDHAIARGAIILAELASFATTCDGSHITSPATEGMMRCMSLALQEAHIKPEEVDYINAHATGTPMGDAAEAQATAKLFRDQVPVSSTKSYMGHTLGACGGIESIVAIQCIREGLILGNRNLDEIGSDCTSLQLIRETESRKVQIAMNNNFAFGGINTSLVFFAHSGDAPT